MFLFFWSKVRKANLRHEELSSGFKRDVHNARMFLAVVAVLLLCHIFPAIHYVLFFGGNIYAEMQSGSIFMSTINSAINMPIYYSRDSSFRRETNSLFAKLLKPRNNEAGSESNEKQITKEESVLSA